MNDDVSQLCSNAGDKQMLLPSHGLGRNLRGTVTRTLLAVQTVSIQQLVMCASNEIYRTDNSFLNYVGI
jgi:hypothetical protein